LDLDPATRGATAARRIPAVTVCSSWYEALNYFLSNHAFLCTTGNQCIILDLKRDQYLFADVRQLSALGPHLDGWERSTQTLLEDADDPTPDVISFADDLVTRGILTIERRYGKAARPLIFPKPVRALRTVAGSARWPMTRFPHFWCAASCANSLLKRKSMEFIVGTVQRRKHAASVGSSPFDFYRARALLAQFYALRPFFPRKYLCLFDSLALLEFFSRFALYPTWVFAVIPEPFEAHCWLQQEDVVLNDSVEEVTKFTPIMAI
jgi:hypothetical protein